MPKIIGILLLQIVLLQGAFANNTAENFAKALQLQLEGQTSESIKLYESMLQEEQFSSEIYNNLGLAYSQNNKLGKAILNFERALKWDSNNADARHNLAAAQQRIAEPLTSPEPIFFVGYWLSAVSLFSSTVWAVLFLLFWSLGLASFGLWRWQGKTQFRTIGAVVLLFSLLVLLLGFQQKALENDDSFAIITKKQVGIRSEPSLGSAEIEWIGEGIKAKILEQKEGWVYIELPNHLLGWLPQNMLEKI